MVHVGSCLLEMLLHSCFEVLLGGSNVEFVGETVHDLVNYQFVSAHVVVVTCCGEFVAAVAGEVLVVSQDDFFVEFGIDVTVKKFPEVFKSLVGHGDSDPRKVVLLFEFIDCDPNWCLPFCCFSNTEVCRSFPISTFLVDFVGGHSCFLFMDPLHSFG